jgi:hypothetical protein
LVFRRVSGCAYGRPLSPTSGEDEVSAVTFEVPRVCHRTEARVKRVGGSRCGRKGCVQKVVSGLYGTKPRMMFGGKTMGGTDVFNIDLCQ